MNLVAAYQHFDKEVLAAWTKLLENFARSLQLDKEDLEETFGGQSRPDKDEDEPDDDFDTRLLEYQANWYDRMVDLVRLCEWRSILLGQHIGRFMQAYAATFHELTDVWCGWRSGALPGEISELVRSVSRTHFAIALTARNLLWTRDWRDYTKEVLSLPSYGGLVSIPGLIRVENAFGDIPEFQRLLDEAPGDLETAVLYVAQSAADSMVQRLEHPQLLVTDNDLEKRLERIIADKLDPIRTQLDDIRYRQDAQIDRLETFVSHLSKTDRDACEKSLENEMPGIYSRLVPQARRLLVAAEQIFRLDSEAPEPFVQALASAFETQARDGVLSNVLAFLKNKKSKAILSVDRKDFVYRDSFTTDWYDLGKMGKLFSNPDELVTQALDLIRIKRDDAIKAIENC